MTYLQDRERASVGAVFEYLKGRDPVPGRINVVFSCFLDKLYIEAWGDDIGVL